MVPQYQPTTHPVEEPSEPLKPFPAPIDIRSRYGMTMDQYEAVKGMVAACPKTDSGQVMREGLSADHRSLLAALCVAYDQGRMAEIARD